ncbi:MAG: winged helix-turn-helix domain-containing protein [Gammaproteobacteria bacterium]
METQSALCALASLAQESRLAIFRALVEAGPAGLSAGKISKKTGIPPRRFSFTYKELAHADMVVSRQESRFVIYSANFLTMNALIAFLTENCCGGNPCNPICAPGAALTQEYSA